MNNDSHTSTESDQAIPWRESSHFDDQEKLPGRILAGARYREDLTQIELSRRTGISRDHISKMENGHKPISEANAQKIADVLSIDRKHLLTT